MENLTLEELRLLRDGMVALYWDCDDNEISEKKSICDLTDKIKQAIADKEFEEKTRPLNF